MHLCNPLQPHLTVMKTFWRADMIVDKLKRQKDKMDQSRAWYDGCILSCGLLLDRSVKRTSFFFRNTQSIESGICRSGHRSVAVEVEIVNQSKWRKCLYLFYLIDCCRPPELVSFHFLVYSSHHRQDWTASETISQSQNQDNETWSKATTKVQCSIQRCTATRGAEKVVFALRKEYNVTCAFCETEAAKMRRVKWQKELGSKIWMMKSRCRRQERRKWIGLNCQASRNPSLPADFSRLR